jgi:hypothetical protein
LIKGPSGGYKAFMFPSTGTLNELQDTAGEKIRVHPHHLRLRYRVGGPVGKAGQDGTDVTSREEFKLFIDHMRPLIVPQRTASGKISSRTLKPIQVYFIDTNTGNESFDTNEGNTKPGSRKVDLLASHETPYRLLYRRWQIHIQISLKYAQNAT